MCGVSDNLHRHSIVPHAYRACFPDFIKSRSSHDIVLICTRCMTKCMDADARRKEVLRCAPHAPHTHSTHRHTTCIHPHSIALVR